jgi:hypothetical protein
MFRSYCTCPPSHLDSLLEQKHQDYFSELLPHDTVLDDDFNAALVEFLDQTMMCHSLLASVRLLKRLSVRRNVSHHIGLE